MDYPAYLQIETSASCNAACSFCPHSTMNRTGSQRMSDATFKRLIDEVATWGRQPHYICPFLTNEPFADARIYDFSAYINEKLPRTSLVFFTNGSLFTPGNIKKLSSIKRILSIHCSVHHSTKEEYEAELKLPFDKTIESIKRLIEMPRLFPVVILRVSDGDAAKDDRFKAFVEQEFKGASPQISYRYNWKGGVSSHIDYKDTLDIVCPRHSAMTVLYDGRVSLCCMDQAGEYPLGDTKKETLLEIYNGSKALQFRTKTKRENSPCNTCNMKG